ncbi:hypothetical protein ABII15_33005 [Streptomyces sp. HUAS MG91]|uniref:Uncharacterized protein n=1 Tax=Streptomyces tabacisoli TaxID=3156398 RepID=A0AAU8J187_9ACTN
MALISWDVHLKTGQLASFAALLTTALVGSARLWSRRPEPARTAVPPPSPPPAPCLRAHVVPTHSTPADPAHTAAVTDLCTRVSEVASDLAKRYGNEE